LNREKAQFVKKRIMVPLREGKIVAAELSPEDGAAALESPYLGR